MQNQLIRVEVRENSAWVTLSRPQKLNSLTDPLMVELKGTLDTLALNDDVRVIVLQGDGKAFSSGFDLSGSREEPLSVSDWNAHIQTGAAAMRAVWMVPQPVIAKIRGACLGGGFDLSLACDLAIASDDAYFGEPEVKFGGGSMFMVLPWLMGLRQVNELLLTGRIIDSQRALEFGFLNEVVSGDELDDRIEALVAHMCLLPGGTLQKNKRLVHRVYELMGVLNAVQISADTSTLALSSKGGEAAEFDTIVQAEGLASALKWQKDRYLQAGAYPR